MSKAKQGMAVAELFAGVGGFRLGLERAGRWSVMWSNQWEPGSKKQYASSCYERNFGADGHVNEDIARFLDWEVGGDADAIPVDSQVGLPRNLSLLVGGFPCQDYSVAKPLSHSSGIQGKKGVLWWEINRLIEHSKPKYVLLENVDRLLKSPSSQRGRDFAVMLACFARQGYSVQWRVVNAAEYGYPQRRRRVFILAERTGRKTVSPKQAHKTITTTGVLARALPVSEASSEMQTVAVGLDPYQTSKAFGLSHTRSIWANAGLMVNGVAFTMPVMPRYDGPRKLLADVLETKRVDSKYFIDPAALQTWTYLKGSKKEPRVDKATGYTYSYNEGPVAFPDPLTGPSRTILTSEGGVSPSRSTHVIRKRGGKPRRLTPVELERLQGFPDNWTKYDNTGGVISDRVRGFFMGNALVVGLVEAIGSELANRRDNKQSCL